MATRNSSRLDSTQLRDSEQCGLLPTDSRRWLTHGGRGANIAVINLQQTTVRLRWVDAIWTWLMMAKRATDDPSRIWRHLAVRLRRGRLYFGSTFLVACNRINAAPRSHVPQPLWSKRRKFLKTFDVRCCFRRLIRRRIRETSSDHLLMESQSQNAHRSPSVDRCFQARRYNSFLYGRVLCTGRQFPSRTVPSVDSDVSPEPACRPPAKRGRQCCAASAY